MKHFFSLSLILYSSLIYSQNNTITLGNFDNFTGNCQIGQQADPHPFIDSSCNTQGWYASHGTPHLVNNQVGNSTTFIQTYDAAPDRPDCCSGEGIFREYDFNLGTRYLLTFRFYLPTIQHQSGEFHFLPDLFVRLTNQLDVPPPFPGTGEDYPNVTDAQVVFNLQDVQATDEWITFNISFTPSRNYSQIWFVGENRWDESPNVQGYFYLDDVVLIENYTPEITDGCCPENVSYTNTSSLPSLTEVNNSIEAGPNVTVQSGQNVTFKAGNSILLKPGFTAEQGSIFSALIDDCSDPLSLTLNINRSFCDATVVPEICGGTGFYNYVWNIGERTPTITVTPSSTTNYSLTITDVGTGNSITRSVSVGQDSEFYENFSVFIPNVFTPNGDGVNDRWEVRDADVGFGAIKAYDYDLTVVNRAGVAIFDKSASNPTGFNGGDIYWDGKNNNGSWMPSGVYYYSVILKNCSNPNGQNFNGWVQILGSQASATNGRIANSVETDSTGQLIIGDTFKFWPNPTDNLIKVDFAVSCESSLKVTLLNLEGKVIQTLENNPNQIPGRYSSEYRFNSMEAGIYFIKYETIEYSTIEKIIIE